jgi:hypothetical protein
MGRKCCVCSDGRRDEIERALLCGTAFRYLSKRFGISAASLLRHKASHLPRTLVKAQEVAEVTRSGGLLHHVQTLVGRTESLYQEAQAILSEAKADGDQRTALAAIREAAAATRETRGHLELLGKLSGELANSSATVNVECVVMLPPAPRSTTNATVLEVKILPESERSRDNIPEET